MSLIEKIASCSRAYTDTRKTLSDPSAKSKSLYKIDNTHQKEFKVIRMDACVFHSNEAKCDYGMEVDNTIHFIELKGSDNNQGLKQLYQTLLLTKDHYSNHTKKARLIVSRAEAPRNLDMLTIRKIAGIVGDTMNGSTNNFIKANNQFTESLK